MKLSSLVNKLAWSHGRSAHRCAGYVRQEITLATKTGDSAVVSHDAPSPLEICSVCHEVVGVHEVFRCDCGDPNPGSRPTVKCQACKFWSHSDCVGDLKDFICQSCEREDSPPLTPPPLEDSRFYFGEDGSIHDSPRRLNTAVGSALCLICGRATLQWTGPATAKHVVHHPPPTPSPTPMMYLQLRN
ncbi:hypothetical protein C8R44DRAFT_141228 [Mycena epipterygia]|nr:hypothetical protein C8R44DRAFT_141228 [Mycena epipterygia]